MILKTLTERYPLDAPIPTEPVAVTDAQGALVGTAWLRRGVEHPLSVVADIELTAEVRTFRDLRVRWSPIAYRHERTREVRNRMEMTERPMTIKELFHALWTASVGKPWYDKSLWMQLEQQLLGTDQLTGLSMTEDQRRAAKFSDGVAKALKAEKLQEPESKTLGTQPHAWKVSVHYRTADAPRVSHLSVGYFETLEDAWMFVKGIAKHGSLEDAAIQRPDRVGLVTNAVGPGLEPIDPKARE